VVCFDRHLGLHDDALECLLCRCRGRIDVDQVHVAAAAIVIRLRVVMHPREIPVRLVGVADVP
jgi:hypothetical protein